MNMTLHSFRGDNIMKTIFLMIFVVGCIAVSQYSPLYAQTQKVQIKKIESSIGNGNKPSASLRQKPDENTPKSFTDTKRITPAFVLNKGQWASDVRYQLRLPNQTVWITDKGIVIDEYRKSQPRVPTVEELEKGLASSNPMKNIGRTGWEDPQSIEGHVIRMNINTSVVSPKSAPVLTAKGQQVGVHNYFIGDSSLWAVDVPLYDEVLSQNSNGVTTRYYTEHGSFRYDFILQPGTSPESVGYAIEGATSLSINKQGNLVVRTSIGETVHKDLVAYQVVNGKKNIVPCSFALDKLDATKISFKLGNYDKANVLIIDPLIWSSFLGGGAGESINDIAVDASGNTVVVGSTDSSNFPTTVGAYKRTFTFWKEGSKAIISRIAPNGSTLLFSTFLGAENTDIGYGVTLDPSGNIIVCGMTASVNFPTTSGAYQRTKSGSSTTSTPVDGFITKINTSGNALIASTYLGASNNDYLYDVASNTNGIAVTGFSASSSYPVTSGVYQPNRKPGIGTGTVIVSVLTQNLQSLTTSTFLGGWCEGNSIAYDNGGNVLVAGVVYDDSLPTTSTAIKRAINGLGGDGFVAKLNGSLTQLLYSTYIGGWWLDEANGVASDPFNGIYVCGGTGSFDMLTTAGAYDRSYNSVRGSSLFGALEEVYDGFVIKVNGNSNTLEFATYIGGKQSELFRDIVVDNSGNSYLTGHTYSADYPATSCCVDSSQNGRNDALMTILNASGNGIIYSTFIGAGGAEFGRAIARDNSGMVYVAGTVDTMLFHTTQGTFQTVRSGGASDGFIQKIDPTPSFSVFAGNDFRYSCVGIGRQVLLGAIPSCGKKPFTFSWSPGGFLDDSTANFPKTIADSIPREFVVTVTDSSGQVARNSVTVVPLIMKLIPGRDTVICWGRNARLTTRVTGGFPPLRYIWAPSDKLDSLDILNPLVAPDSTTNYVVLITDATGCTEVDTVRVQVSRGRLAKPIDTVLCNGVRTVKLEPQYIGAIPPLRYQWLDSKNVVVSTLPSPTFTVDSAVTVYTLQVRDSLNCLSTQTATIRRSLPMTAKISGDTIVCKGDSARIRLVVSGGVKPYLIQWKSPSMVNPNQYTTADSANIIQSVDSVTTFTATIYDSLFCIRQFTYTVRPDSASSPKITTTNNIRALCDGASLQLDAGAISNATYQWSTGESTRRITVNKEGGYKVVIRNKNGCSGSDSVFIRVSPNPKPILATPDTTICDGGSVVLRVQGEYKTYLWTDGARTPTNIVYIAGNYGVTVTDTNGCSGVSSRITVAVNKLDAQLDGPSSICANVDGNFTVTQIPKARYVWSLSGGVANGQIVNGQSTNSITTRWSAIGADSIIVVVTDSIGCTVRKTLAVTINNTIKPTITSQGSPVLCGTGSSVTLNAQSGYSSYSWLPNGETTRSITVSQPGKYSVSVTSGGCSGKSDDLEVRTAPPIQLNVSTTKQTLCPSETTDIKATSGLATYRWNTGAVTEQITVADSGTYSVVVTDTNGCTASSELRVTRRAYSIVGTNNVQFTTTVIGATTTTKASWTNRLSESVTIEKTELSSGNGIIAISGSIPSNPPVTLQPNQTFELTFTFSPTDSATYTNSLTLYLSTPCPDTLTLTLSGQGTRNSASSRIAMTNVTAGIGERNVKLPIYLSVTSTQVVPLATVRISMRCDTALFQPTNVSRGTIQKNSIENGQRVIEVELADIDVNKPDTVVSFIGTALTDFNRRNQTVASVEWRNIPPISFVSQEGSLKIEGCTTKDFPIQFISTSTMMIAPNPTDDNINISVQTGEAGQHSLTVYSIDGVSVCGDEFTSSGKGEVRHQYTSPKLAQGIYYVILKSPLTSQTMKVMVLK
jgi:hypothetical protein